MLSQGRSAPSGEAILGELIDGLPLVALVANDSAHYVVANRQASAVTGYSNRELRASSVWDLTPSGMRQDNDALWRAFLQQREQVGDHVLLTKDGQSITAAYAALAHVLPGLHLSLMSPKQR